MIFGGGWFFETYLLPHRGIESSFSLVVMEFDGLHHHKTSHLMS